MYSRAGLTLIAMQYIAKSAALAPDLPAWTATVGAVAEFCEGAPSGANLPTISDALDWDENVVEWMLSGGVYRRQGTDPRPVRAIDLLRRAHALLGTLVPPTKAGDDLARRVGGLLSSIPDDVRIDPAGYDDYCEACRDWMEVVA